MSKGHLALSASVVPNGPSPKETRPPLKWPDRKSEGRSLKCTGHHKILAYGEVKRRGLGKATEIRERRWREDSLV